LRNEQEKLRLVMWRERERERTKERERDCCFNYSRIAIYRFSTPLFYFTSSVTAYFTQKSDRLFFSFGCPSLPLCFLLLAELQQGFDSK